MWCWRIWFSGGLDSVGLMVSLDDSKDPLQPKLHNSVTLKGTGHRRRGNYYTKKELGCFSGHRTWWAQNLAVLQVFSQPWHRTHYFQEFPYIYSKELVLFCSGSIAQYCLDSAFQTLTIFEFQAVFVWCSLCSHQHKTNLANANMIILPAAGLKGAHIIKPLFYLDLQ